MNKEELKNLVAKGKLEDAINLLVEISNQFLLYFNEDIILLSSRFNTIKSEKIKGIIRSEDYSIESNSITNSILKIISLIDELDISKIKKKSDSIILKEIDELNSEFDETNKIQSATSRLRMKNSIAKSIGEKFVQYPEVFKKYLPTDSNGIICGLCMKIQSVPEFGDLDPLELVAKGVLSNFVKGCITNTVAELVYSQKLQIGDDERIKKILNNLKENADIPLAKNIDRVEAALNYLITGK